MPLVKMNMVEGVFTPEQKKELVRQLTDVVVSIGGANIRPVTWVVLEEVKSGEWGIGGNPITTADVQGLLAGKKP